MGDYFSLLEFVVESIDLVIKTCCADFAGFIDEVDGEESALTTLIMPLFDIGFISYANLDGPSSINHRFRNRSTCFGMGIALRWDRH